MVTERDLSQCLEIAIATARSAGDLLMSYYEQNVRVSFKGEVNLVTEADEASEEHIIGRIREHFPEDGFLGEEGGKRGATGNVAARWVIDPLDGTTNFAHGYPIFGVSIALDLNEVTEVGVVYMPLLGQLFAGRRGAGATVNGEPLSVSATDDLIRSLVATGFLYNLSERGRNLRPWASFVHATQGVRRDGAATFDLCCVAAGRLDGFWEEGLSPWDTAAGALMVREAGGRITTYDGKPYSPDKPSCLASNGHIHDAMLGLLAQGR